MLPLPQGPDQTCWSDHLASLLVIFCYLEDFLCWLIGGLLWSVLFGAAANVDSVAIAKSVELAVLLVLHEAFCDHCLWWGLGCIPESIDRQKLHLRVAWRH